MRHITHLFALSLVAVASSAQELKLHHTFETLEGTGATLHGGAVLATQGELPILDLGAGKGYLDLGAGAGAVLGSLKNFTITTYVYVPQGSDLGAAGNFIYSFANSDNIAADANGCLFFSAKETRYAISRKHWEGEQQVSLATPFTMGEWRHVTYTQKGTNGSVYINGELMKTGRVTITPYNVGKTACNYLGKPCYATDSYLIGARYCDFRIYDAALGEEDVKALSADKLDKLNMSLFTAQLGDAAQALVLEGTGALDHDLDLPATAGNGIAISWASSDEAVITAGGRITRPAHGSADVAATLTATFTKGDAVLTRDYAITVKAQLDDRSSVEQDLAHLVLTGHLESLYEDLVLPVAANEGSAITWSTSDARYLGDDGTLNRLAAKGEKKVVVLTATATKGAVSGTREFNVTIGQDEGYCAYLFTYFTGNDPRQEQVCFALSQDGYSFIPLNEGDPVIASDTISIKKAVRDPHILRGEDGETFYMVITDMRCNQGWDSNDGMVLMKSSDLINWTHTAIDFPDTWPELFDRDDLTQVWAPQTIYDPVEKKYMVYYSIGMKSQPHYTIWYSYANDDFTQLTRPQVLFDLGSNTIDADIVFSDGLYHLFFKTEGEGNGIQKATAPSLQGPWTPVRTYLQQTDVAVEGSGVFKLINSNHWVLMYDCYTSGHYQFCSSADLEKFTFVCNTPMSGKFTPRHGTIIPVSLEEVQRLMARWPSKALEGFDVAVGVEAAHDAAAACRVDYYTLDGLRVDAPRGSGVYLKREQLQGGKSRVTKLMVP